VRYEYKFYVHKHKIPLLRSIITTKLKLDENVNPEKPHYTVRSIYFDSLDLKHYYEKINSMKHRKKVRLRGYDFNPESKVFFEVKRKYEEPGMKNRFQTDYKSALAMLKSKEIDKSNDDLVKFFYQIMSFNLRPIVNVIYDREPYAERVRTQNNLRVTFDKNLRSVAYPKIDELFVDDNVKPAMLDYFILEVKLDDFLPGWIRQMSESLSLKRESASKYVICIDNEKSIVKQSRFAYLRAQEF
jgi:SPX domain protein involved in polyphosphate accumulation